MIPENEKGVRVKQGLRCKGFDAKRTRAGTNQIAKMQVSPSTELRDGLQGWLNRSYETKRYGVAFCSVVSPPEMPSIVEYSRTPSVAPDC